MSTGNTEAPGPEVAADVRVWANLWLGNADPGEAGRAAAAHAALESACAERGVRFERSPFVVDGYVDAYAEGTEAEIVPLLVALGEKGHSYAMDVSVEDRLDAVADAGGKGVAYAEHQVF